MKRHVAKCLDNRQPDVNKYWSAFSDKVKNQVSGSLQISTSTVLSMLLTCCQRRQLLNLWQLFSPALMRAEDKLDTGWRLSSSTAVKAWKKGQLKKRRTQTHRETLGTVCAERQQHAQTHTDILCHSSSCECVHKRASQSSGGVCL